MTVAQFFFHLISLLDWGVMGTEHLVQSLVASARGIQSTEDFVDWIRRGVRRRLPHAAFLATLGRLYGIGSVPTHRIAVDFPLVMVEALKTSSGALDDPLMAGWLRSGKLRFVPAVNGGQNDGQRRWSETLSNYGFRNVLIHGVLDHKARRFAIFEFFNCCEDMVGNGKSLVQDIVGAASDAAWNTVDLRSKSFGRDAIGHPTNMLTATELHIVQLIAQGLSNKEIARLRGVSDSTIKTQVQRTGSKLGATRRAEIVALAMPFLCPLPPQTLIDYGDDRTP